MTDDDRKILTEYIGECWHIDGAMSHEFCPCGVRHAFYIDGAMNRTFDTPDDLHAVYSKMCKKGGWAEFQNEMVYKFREIEKDDYTRWFIANFEKWLFCLNCPDEILERMKMVAEFIKGKGGL